MQTRECPHFFLTKPLPPSTVPLTLILVASVTFAIGAETWDGYSYGCTDLLQCALHLNRRDREEE